MIIRHYEDLKVWQEARDISSDLNKVLISTEGNFDYKELLEEKAVNIMKSISHGTATGSYKDLLKGLENAKQEAEELKNMLYTALEVKISDHVTVNIFQFRLDDLIEKIEDFHNQVRLF